MAMQEELEKHGNYLFKYRSSLPLIILFSAISIFIYKKIYSIPSATGLSDSYILICFAVSLIGFFMRVYTVGHTPNRTSGRNTKQQLAEVLNTTGSYSMVRHPLYVGNYFMWLGLSMLTNNIWFVVIFSLIYWVYYERIMFAEEQFLRKKFGEDYLNWAEKTPAFMPSLKNFCKPSTPFSWKKVLKKEKNGFFAVVLIIFLFNYISEFKNNSFNISYDAWFFLMVFGLVSYLAIKYIRKYTKLLNE